MDLLQRKMGPSFGKSQSEWIRSENGLGRPESEVVRPEREVVVDRILERQSG